MAFISIDNITQQRCAVKGTGYRAAYLVHIIEILRENASTLSVKEEPHSKEV
jgi:hypothetical protein